jgi:diadenosine tetraphosphate (Ap4A) HIT family hydrolase
MRATNVGRWEADERPEPRSLGLLPSGPDPVGEWLVHRQPPGPISAARVEKASQAPSLGKLGTMCDASGKMSETRWTLHPQLHADTVPVCDLALSQVLAMNDANFPWLILVPRRAGVSEIFDLGAEQTMLFNEVSLVSRVLKDVTQCDKLNVAAIGNVVPQLHIHIVARRKDDALWPKPVWGVAPPRAYESAALERFATAIRDRLWSTPSL